MELVFEWDETKAKANHQKHEVNFTEAKTIFNDPLQMTYSDIEHSQNEDRFISIGVSVNGRTLVVIHTGRGGKVRIISSRKATNTERQFYEEQI